MSDYTRRCSPVLPGDSLFFVEGVTQVTRRVSTRHSGMETVDVPILRLALARSGFKDGVDPETGKIDKAIEGSIDLMVIQDDGSLLLVENVKEDGEREFVVTPRSFRFRS